VAAKLRGRDTFGNSNNALTLTLVAPDHKVRFRRVVERIGKEAFWLYTEDIALRALGTVYSRGLDFFRVAHVGIQGDRMIRLIRILEEDAQVASFWYLYRCEPTAVEKAARAANVDLKFLRDLEARLKTIRDKVFVHIDKHGVFDPNKIYKDAGVTHKDVRKAAESLWHTVQELHNDLFGRHIVYDRYTGDDIVLLAKARDDGKLV
jgi:hypothetical protein